MRHRRRLALAVTGWILLGVGLARADGPFDFYTIRPCRLVDTRLPDGPLGGPVLGGGVARVFPLAGNCSIPPNATAVVLDIVVVQPAVSGTMLAWAAGTPQPATSTSNYDPVNYATALQTVVGLGGTPGSISLVCSSTAHIVIDATAYYQ